MRLPRSVRALTFALLLALAPAPAWGQAAPARLQSGQPTDAASAARLSQWRARVETGATVRLLVGLQLPMGVSAATARTTLRPAVAQVRSRVLARAANRLPAARAATTLPLIVVEVDADGLEALAADPEVVTLEEDFAAVQRLTQSVPIVQADQMAAQGYRGTGWAVAVLDDGVDASHAAFGGRVVAEACFSGHTQPSASLCPNGATSQVGAGAAAPCPTCTHGTHVAGIAAGSSGVAPDAPIIAVQVFSSDSSAYFSDILLAIDHVLTLADSMDVAAVNMSIGTGSGLTTPCDGLSSSVLSAFAALRSAGIAPLVAAGNSGATTSGLEFPGCLSNAISVGATDDNDGLASFSNTATSLQLLAPGVGIVAPVPGGGTTSKNGTSMATPHVAGAWALLRQRVPSASVASVLAALRATGVSVFDSDTSTSFPRIRILAAAENLAPFSISPTSWAPAAGGGTQAVGLTSGATGATWSTSSSAAWLTMSPTSGSGTATVTLSAAANASSALPRSATATIAGRSVSVTQAGATPTFGVSPSTAWSVSSSGGTRSITVTSSLADATWSATTDAAWLTASPSGGTGSASTTLTAASNASSAQARSATATIAGESVSVTQAGTTPTFGVSPSTAWSVSSSGGTRSITVTSSLADATWNVTTDAAWLTASPTGGTGSASTTLTAAPNTSSALPRTATATVAGQSVSVTQAGATPTFGVSPSTAWSVSSSGGTRIITVTSSLADAAWNATTDAAWLTASPTGGTGSASTTLTAAPNTSSSQPRTATATIAGQTVSVSQDGFGITLSPSSTSIAASGGPVMATVVTTPSGVPWTASSNAAWVTVDPASGSGTTSLTIVVQPHVASIAPRTATVTVGGQPLSITQAGATPTLTLSPTSAAIPASGGVQVLTLTASPADAAWTATSSVAWASVSPASGTGSASLTVTVAPDTTSLSPRSTTISVGSAVATIAQAAPMPTFGVAPGTATAPAGGATIPVSVTTSPAGASWTAASLADWLVVSPTQGAGDALVSLVVAPRTSVNPRTGSVTVAGRTITVSQDGAVPTLAIAPESITEHAEGGAQAIAVTASVPDAPWTTSSALSWVSVAPSAATGSGVVSIAIAPHVDLAPRSGTITVAGRTVLVTQAAHAPTATTTEDGWVAPAGGGARELALDVPPERPSWTAFTDVPWLTVSPSVGLGDAHVSIAALPAASNGAGLAATGLPSPLPSGAAVVTVTQPHDGAFRTGTVVFVPVEAPSSHARYLAEGATSTFFDTRLAILNPSDADTTATLTFLRAGQPALDVPLSVPARTRRTVWPRTVPGLQQAEFSTVVTAAAPVVVDRTMTWDGAGYGAHAETASAAASSRWYFAEGATHSGFSLFYLLQNPGDRLIRVRARYLRASGGPLEKTYELGPQSRINIWANVEEFPGLGRALAAEEFSAVLESIDGEPFIAERAMYRSTHGRLFDAGHEGMGVASPAPRWFLAEGRTGPFFDMFVLVANPSDVAATVRVSYLLDSGATLQRTFVAPANARVTIWVDEETFDGVPGRPLADAAVSTTVESLNGVPLVVERAMWWPGDGNTWHEAHDAAGTTRTGTAWALAEGEVGGASAAETYVLIANTSAFAGRARVTVMLEDGTSHMRVYPLAPSARTTAAIGPDFGSAVTDKRFGVVVEALGVQDDDPVPEIVVERAMYADAGGTRWAAGTSAVGTRLR